tara:strand:- start:2783 stop:3847 length:1065 start_codon:yes stop_codon:yes gene_type:complete
MKLGIVGTGNISSKHLDEFQKIKNVNVEAVCDTNEKNLNIFLDKYKLLNIRGYLTLGEMLKKEKNFDGISNTTPDKFHKATTLQILEKGYNIFCEKPLAENYEDAKEMVAAALKSKKINMVNFTYREASAYQKLVDTIKSGAIGIPRHISASYYQSWLTSNKWGDWRKEDKWLWRLSKKHGSNGALGDTGVHIFDFAVNAVGDIKEVFADLKTYKDKGRRIKNYVLDANDGFNALVRFENGAIGTITNTRYATGHANSLILEVFCTKGSVKVELDEERTKWTTLHICQAENINRMSWQTIDCPKTSNNYQNFIKYIQINKNMQPDFKQGAKIQKIIDSCIKSNDNNSWIDINNI